MMDKMLEEFISSNTLVEYEYDVLNFPKEEGWKKNSYAHGIMGPGWAVQIHVGAGMENNLFVHKFDSEKQNQSQIFALVSIHEWKNIAEVWHNFLHMITREGRMVFGKL